MAQSGINPQMKIFLKTIKTIALDVHSSDTIEDIKAKVCTIEGIRGSQQELFFVGNHLSDPTKTLSNYSIPNNSTINLYIGNGIQITVNLPNGKALNLGVKSWDTIKQVKARIEDKEGISHQSQELFYLGRSLKDHEILSACIKNSSSLQLLVRPTPLDELELCVEMLCGKSILLDVRSWFTVKDVKMMIESIQGVPCNQQRLLYGGKELVDHVRLSEYKVVDKCTIKLVSRVQILIKTWTGKTVTLMVEVYDTVSEAMAKLRQKMGCNLSDFMFLYAGKILEGDKTLEYYEIRGGETLHLRGRMSSCQRFLKD